MALYHTLVARNVELRVILSWGVAFLHRPFLEAVVFAARSNIVTVFMTLVATRGENKIDPKEIIFSAENKYLNKLFLCRMSNMQL